ncbi:MAG: polyprenyl synthetase family protein [Steroidobacteraceae bacterium]|jgi:geranylgeranyl diphosphate synthase type II|nr:polyprenyl synthetase family protein [Steroidobacteraceae bacterium]
MDAAVRIDRALAHLVDRAQGAGSPPGLAEALRYAVFPGGQRLRPRLCLAVAQACGEDAPDLTDAAAAAVELIHCASLIHDDLPCFDDAATRRGRATTHRVYGEPRAVLAGDTLIVLAFEALALAGARYPARLPGLVLTLAAGTGMPSGLCAGQGWESESAVRLADYQRAKTGALFAAATAAGAAAAGHDAPPWRLLGERLGEAYQVADDVRDVAADPVALGKPTGRDAALGRPNAVHELGLDGAVRRLDTLVAAALEAVPPCAGAQELRALVLAQAVRLVPRHLRHGNAA